MEPTHVLPCVLVGDLPLMWCIECGRGECCLDLVGRYLVTDINLLHVDVEGNTHQEVAADLEFIATLDVRCSNCAVHHKVPDSPHNQRVLLLNIHMVRVVQVVQTVERVDVLLLGL